MGTVKASSVSLSGSDAAAKKATCCTEDVSGKCSGNTASATDLAEQANDGTYQFACGAGFTVKASSVSLSGSDAAAKKAACCTENTCTAKANAAAWTAVGVTVAGSADATKVSGLGTIGTAAGWTGTAAVTCPTSGNAFNVA